jgi:hypothetical protein
MIEGANVIEKFGFQVGAYLMIFSLFTGLLWKMFTFFTKIINEMREEDKEKTAKFTDTINNHLDSNTKALSELAHCIILLKEKVEK